MKLINGQHYFATASRSITDKNKAKEIFDRFKKLFKEGDGFKIDVTLNYITGESIEFGQS